MKRLIRGFTLVEIMIVVAIIGLLAAIAIPSFVKSRNTSREKACVNNLRQIDAAKEQWIMENDISQGAPSVDAEINVYMKRGRPVCPSGGDYTYEVAGTPAACSIAGHAF